MSIRWCKDIKTMVTALKNRSSQRSDGLTGKMQNKATKARGTNQRIDIRRSLRNVLLS